MTDEPVRLAVIGAGSIGRRHVAHAGAERCAALIAIVDPTEAGRTFADETGAQWYSDVATMLRHSRPEAVIVATPNRMHLQHGLQAIGAGIPVLMEKPLAIDVAEATQLVDAAERAGVALMTGHHRRHNPLIQAAKQAIEGGRLGRIVSVQGTCWFHKSAAYFEVPWRTQPGAGPVLLNLIHDIDLLRYLCGEVTAVQAMESNAVRGHAVEETAVILLRFASGILGTVTVSDTIAAPWSWEFTSGENPAYTHTPEACYQIGGTEGALSIPYLDLWRHPIGPDWFTPIVRERLPAQQADPLALQIRNLCGVVRGTAAPLVSGRDGLQTLRVIEAVKQAAASGQIVHLEGAPL